MTQFIRPTGQSYSITLNSEYLLSQQCRLIYNTYKHAESRILNHQDCNDIELILTSTSNNITKKYTIINEDNILAVAIVIPFTVDIATQIPQYHIKYVAYQKQEYAITLIEHIAKELGTVFVELDYQTHDIFVLDLMRQYTEVFFLSYSLSLNLLRQEMIPSDIEYSSPNIEYSTTENCYKATVGKDDLTLTYIDDPALVRDEDLEILLQTTGKSTIHINNNYSSGFDEDKMMLYKKRAVFDQWVSKWCNQDTVVELSIILKIQ